MKFGWEYVDAILNREKTATIRYGWEGLRPGDTLKMVNAESGEAFARATIDVISESPLREASEAVRVAGGKHGSRPGTLLDNLNDHYEEDLTLETEVHGVVFTVDEDLRGPDLERRRRGD